MLTVRGCKAISIFTTVVFLCNALLIVTGKTPLQIDYFSNFPQATGVFVLLLIATSMIPSISAYCEFGRVTREREIKEELNIPEFMKQSLTSGCYATELIKLLNLAALSSCLTQVILLGIFLFTGINEHITFIVLSLVILKGIDGLISADIFSANLKVFTS